MLASHSRPQSSSLSGLRERRALGNPETKCLLIGFREEKSNASLIGAFMLARGVSRRRKEGSNSQFLALRTLQRMFSYIEFPRALDRSKALVTRMLALLVKSRLSETQPHQIVKAGTH